MAPRISVGLHKRQIFEPQCTHLTMTRLYGPELVCGNCKLPGPFGWLYQCTQDRDDLVEEALSQGEFANMDELSCQLTQKIGIRRRSPAAREDRLSFLKEITQNQLAHYTPDQVAIILRQRENVQSVIQQEKIRKNSVAILNSLSEPKGLNNASCSIGFQKPWLCELDEECRYLVCHNCRPGSLDRAFLSLDGVAQGGIPPTAATGYGFHLMGRRPVIDAQIVENLGCRPVPLPHSSPTASIQDSPASTMSVMDLLDAQIARGRVLWDRSKDHVEIEEYDDDFDWSMATLGPNSISGQLKHSPRCENLGLYTEGSPNGTLAPLLWTPPPSPLANSLAGCDGTSGGRNRTVAAAKRGPEASPLLAKSLQVNRHVREPSLDETPNESDSQTATTRTSIRRSRKAGGKFTPSPLKVPHGVAMLEESVELGVPDVITQA